ncbi:MAG: hypothetical protein WCK93_06120 [Nitrosomonadales bacterium]
MIKKTTIQNTICLAVMTMLLSACATKPVSAPQIPQAANTAPEQASDASSQKTTGQSAFQKQRMMTPQDSIEKNKLFVSYSMKVIPEKTGHLIQVSMVFRNMKDKATRIQPKITLADHKGSVIQPYTKNGFLKLTSRMNGPASSAGKTRRNTVNERINWANSYWLKDKFTIPPNGIEIGELIYHSNSLNYPMKLTINPAGEDYVFEISDTFSTAQAEASPAK